MDLFKIIILTKGPIRITGQNIVYTADAVAATTPLMAIGAYSAVFFKIFLLGVELQLQISLKVVTLAESDFFKRVIFSVFEF